MLFNTIIQYITLDSSSTFSMTAADRRWELAGPSRLFRELT
jgi:hypothetical protein